MEAFDIPALHALCIELSIPGPAAEACLAQAASAQAAPMHRGPKPPCVNFRRNARR